MKNIKTLDIKAKEWFDKSAGNSYFSAQITIDFALDSEKTIYVPIQYGYGDQYLYEALRQLQTAGLLDDKPIYSPSRYCREHNIILRASLTDKCLKSVVKQWGNN